MMRWKRGGYPGRTGIDLAEEALFVLRHSSASVLFLYLIGTIPFILGLLYFWTDMSRSPFAAAYVGQAAIGMSVLYIWMKIWHSIFATRLLAGLTGEIPQPYSTLRIVKLTVAQLAVQPYSLIVIPFCALALLPLPWALAFFHSFSISGNGNHSNLRSALKQAWSLASVWQSQNHLMIFLMMFFCLSIFIAIGIMILFIPFLLDALLGIETIFTRAGRSTFNSTFFAIAAGLTYLCINPLLKTAYVLRAFYGQSLATGADIKAELRAIEVKEERRSISRAGSLLLSVLLLGLLPVMARSSEAHSETISSEQLNESIEQVIQEREYQWRLPREAKDIKSDNDFIWDFLKGVQDTLGQWFKPIQGLVKKVVEWIIDKLFPSSEPGSASSKTSLSDQTVLAVVLISAAVLLLAFLLYRVWKKRLKDEVVIAEESVVAVPDLKDESTTADQFPEEGWLALAREHIERGELRLALRALYLSSLVLLSGRGILTITKYKSNREYHRELQRKAQNNLDLLDAFQENLFLFERSWYGEHTVNGEIINRFNYNHGRMREIA